MESRCAMMRLAVDGIGLDWASHADGSRVCRKQIGRVTGTCDGKNRTASGDLRAPSLTVAAKGVPGRGNSTPVAMTSAAPSAFGDLLERQGLRIVSNHGLGKLWSAITRISVEERNFGSLSRVTRSWNTPNRVSPNILTLFILFTPDDHVPVLSARHRSSSMSEKGLFCL